MKTTEFDRIWTELRDSEVAGACVGEGRERSDYRSEAEILQRIAFVYCALM